jgi:hypothetical protein
MFQHLNRRLHISGIFILLIILSMHMHGPFLGASSCDAEASSSGMTAARMALLGSPARTSASCTSPRRQTERILPKYQIWIYKSVLVDVSGTNPLIPSIRHDVPGVFPRSRFGHPRRRQTHQVWVDGGLGGCPQAVGLGFTGGTVPNILSQDDKSTVS